MMEKKRIRYRFHVSYHISHNENYICCVGRSVNLYDIHTGERKACFRDMRHPNYSAFTGDNRLVVKFATGYYAIYDLASMELIQKIEPPKGVHGADSNFMITPDDKYIISFVEIFPYSQLALIEMETGIYHVFDLNRAATCMILSGKSSGEYYVAGYWRAKDGGTDSRGSTRVLSFCYPFEKLELHQVSETDLCASVSKLSFVSERFAFAGVSDIVYICDGDLDGAIRMRYDRDGVLYHLELSGSGAYLVLATSFKVYVYHVATQKCVKTFDVDDACYASFYDNDTKLFIGTWHAGYLIDLV